MPERRRTRPAHETSQSTSQPELTPDLRIELATGAEDRAQERNHPGDIIGEDAGHDGPVTGPRRWGHYRIIASNGAHEAAGTFASICSATATAWSAEMGSPLRQPESLKSTSTMQFIATPTARCSGMGSV
jgi:hypothetical protein